MHQSHGLASTVDVYLTKCVVSPAQDSEVYKPAKRMTPGLQLRNSCLQDRFNLSRYHACSSAIVTGLIACMEPSITNNMVPGAQCGGQKTVLFSILMLLHDLQSLCTAISTQKKATAPARHAPFAPCLESSKIRSHILRCFVHLLRLPTRFVC